MSVVKNMNSIDSSWIQSRPVNWQARLDGQCRYRLGKIRHHNVRLCLSSSFRRCRQPHNKQRKNVVIGHSSPLDSECISLTRSDVIQKEAGNTCKPNKYKDENEAKVNPSDFEARTTHVAQESLRCLEWREVCRQIARFTHTPNGTVRAIDGGFPIASDVDTCEKMVTETGKMMHILRCQLEKGETLISGFRPMEYILKKLDGLHAASAENLKDEKAIIDAKGLYIILCNLNAAYSLAIKLRQNYSEMKYLSEDIIQNDDGAIDYLRSRLQECIPAEGLGSLLNTASEALEKHRRDERQTGQKIDILMKSIRSSILQQSGSKNFGSVDTAVHGAYRRSCFAVEARVMNIVFDEYAILGKSGSGKTAYVEPEEAFQLNNKRVKALMDAEDEESRILQELNDLLISSLPRIREIMDCVSKIDLISARAAYSMWLQSPEPKVVSWQERMTPEASKMNILSTCHPLILARNLEPLPDAPFWPDERREQLGLGLKRDAGWSGGDQRNIFSEEAALKSLDRDRDADKLGQTGSNPLQGDSSQQNAVRLDIVIPAGVRVVVITGPNAGGKTAALKTIGLSAMLIKCGIWPPADPLSTPILPFYESILADIGEAQSLEQNLSTFSGHMKRLNGILGEVNEGYLRKKSTLVLLDELGSGTDPIEGSALATSTLKHLSTHASLTITTTHFNQLKHLANTEKSNDPTSLKSIMNASPELDQETLESTYKLRWGQAGNSYALELAERIGLRKSVIKYAKTIKSETRVSDAGQKRLEIAESLEKKKDDVTQQLSVANSVKNDIHLFSSEIEREYRQSNSEKTGRIAEFKRQSNSQVDAAISTLKERLEDLSAATSKDVNLLITETDRIIQECQENISIINKESVSSRKQGDHFLSKSSSVWPEVEKLVSIEQMKRNEMVVLRLNAIKNIIEESASKTKEFDSIIDETDQTIHECEEQCSHIMKSNSVNKREAKKSLPSKQWPAVGETVSIPQLKRSGKVIERLSKGKVVVVYVDKRNLTLKVSDILPL